MASIAERYSRAAQSRNLRGSETSLVDIDTLTAAGWSASSGRDASLGAILHRARATQSASSVRSAREAVGAYACACAKRLSSSRSPISIANAVLTWILAPACRLCTGRRYTVIPHTGRLSTVACPACRGTGLARTPYAGDPLAEYLHAALESKMETFTRRMSRSLTAQ